MRFGKYVPFYILLLLLSSRRLFPPFSGRSPLTFASLSAQPPYYPMRPFAHVSTYDDTKFCVRIRHVHIFRPVASASEPTVLATCHSNGRTNERQTPPRILPIPWPRWRKDGLLYIVPIPLSANHALFNVDSTVQRGSIIRNERGRRRRRVYIQLLKKAPEMKNDLRSCLPILEANRFPSSIDYQYRNVSECSLFERYLLQVFKDLIAEGYGVNNFIAECRRGNICPKRRTFEWLTNWGVIKSQ